MTDRTHIEALKFSADNATDNATQQEVTLSVEDVLWIS